MPAETSLQTNHDVVYIVAASTSDYHNAAARIVISRDQRVRCVRLTTNAYSMTMVGFRRFGELLFTEAALRAFPQEDRDLFQRQFTARTQDPSKITHLVLCRTSVDWHRWIRLNEPEGDVVCPIPVKLSTINAEFLGDALFNADVLIDSAIRHPGHEESISGASEMLRELVLVRQVPTRRMAPTVNPRVSERAQQLRDGFTDIILAGNVVESSNWLHNQAVPFDVDTTLVVSSARLLRGVRLHRDVRVHYVGTFDTRRDAVQIENELEQSLRRYASSEAMSAWSPHLLDEEMDEDLTYGESILPGQRVRTINYLHQQLNQANSELGAARAALEAIAESYDRHPVARQRAAHILAVQRGLSVMWLTSEPSYMNRYVLLDTWLATFRKWSQASQEWNVRDDFCSTMERLLRGTVEQSVAPTPVNYTDENGREVVGTIQSVEGDGIVTALLNGISAPAFNSHNSGSRPSRAGEDL